MNPEKTEQDRKILELIHGVKNGDGNAFGELIRMHADQALRLAIAYLKNKVDAEDASQEAFLKAFKNLDSFKGPDGFKSWLLTIVANTCKNRLRWQKIRNRWMIFPINNEETNGKEQDAPEAVFDGTQHAAGQKETAEEVKRAMAHLTEQQSLAVQLRFMEGYKIREIAKIMDLSEGTVKTHLHRGMTDLRKHLKHLREDSNVL